VRAHDVIAALSVALAGWRQSRGVDPGRAQELLQAERERLERLLRRRTLEPSDELSRTDAADLGTDVFEEELDEGIAEEIRVELEAVARAEQRLADGTYGLSIESGDPIPDERLEAHPAAERTAEEQARYDGERI
jgi:DnaK suppressor protein